jgi:uncharacterized membrane protein YdjX (TVP38/TMEM64 family)
MLYIKKIEEPVKNELSAKLKLIAGILLVVALAVAAQYFNLQGLLKSAISWTESLGAAGFAVFILIYILATVLFLPGSILTLGAGALFGVVWGSVCVSIASTLGATAAFLVGRYLARGWVEKQISGNDKFKAIDAAVAREGWKIVGLTRLSPIFPFNLLNYAFGVTQVSLRDYFFASWIGMMPGTVMYVYFGSLGKDLATLGSQQQPSTIQWVLRTVGLIATVLVTVYVTRLAKTALDSKMES